MGKTTRREFIKKSGFTMLAVGVGEQAFYKSLSMAANSALTQAAALGQDDRKLVVIQLAGGNDGLNTVIPMEGTLRTLYEQYRGSSLEVPLTNILPIGRDAANHQLGLHPSLLPLKNLFDQGKVGLVQSVGYPNPSYSHFRSMDIWHTANPVGFDTSGWLGDYFDVAYATTDNPLIAVSIGGGLPLSLRANQVAIPAIGDIETFTFQTDPRFRGDSENRIQTFLALNREAAPEEALVEQIRQTALGAYESSDQLQGAIDRYQRDPAVAYDLQNPLARAMEQAAKIIAGDLGTKILYVTLGGFDTHETQATNDQPLQGTHALLLRWVADAVETFSRDMQRLGKDEEILIMTWSEFGRKVRENGNRGTDHGAAGPQWVIGTPVQGGIYGQHPSLTDLYDGQDALKHTTDFRQVYATILERWLGVDAREILGGSFELIPFV